MSDDQFPPEDAEFPTEEPDSDVSAMFLEMMRYEAEKKAMLSARSLSHVEPRDEIPDPTEFLQDELEDSPELPDDLSFEDISAITLDATDEFFDSLAENANESELIFDDDTEIGFADDSNKDDQLENGQSMVTRLLPSQTTETGAEQAYIVRKDEDAVPRHQRRQGRQAAGVLGGFLRVLMMTGFAAILSATIFTWFTDPGFITQEVVRGLQDVQEATESAPEVLAPVETPIYLKTVGIVRGHFGPENDPGAVCPDGLTEREINDEVATLVVRSLRDRGYRVELLDEFDPRLDQYEAAALLSIHANTCQDYNEFVSGFLVAKAAAKRPGGEDDRLAECVAEYYGEATRLVRRFTLTEDMTDYHTFREIHPLTPAAILELGFMRDDRELLTQQQPLLASGIVNGILCFLEPSAPPTPTPLPSATPIFFDVSTPTFTAP